MGKAGAALTSGNTTDYPTCTDHTRGDGMPNNAAAARRRRLKRSKCGNCGADAARMRLWGTVKIPICADCDDRLTVTVTPDVNDTAQQPSK